MARLLSDQEEARLQAEVDAENRSRLTICIERWGHELGYAYYRYQLASAADKDQAQERLAKIVLEYIQNGGDKGVRAIKLLFAVNEELHDSLDRNTKQMVVLASVLI